MTPHFDSPPFARAPAPTRFYFVRHGESESNRRGIIQGRMDPPLSEAGRSHAAAAARFFADKAIARVYSSPLRRAFETAVTVAAACAIDEPTRLDDLIELDTGIFSGLVFSEIAETHPEQWRRFQRYSWESVPGAEGIDSLYRRAISVWDRLIEDSITGHRAIVCVTHVGFLQWIIRASMGSPRLAWMPIFRAHNCGIYRLTVAPAAAADDLPAGFFAEWDMLDYVPYQETSGE